MAGRAVVLIDAQMIECDAGKTGRIVAVAGGAIQGRRYVSDGLSDTDVAVMAQGAVGGIDEQVIARFKPCSPASIAAVVGWLAENDPPQSWHPEDVLHGPAIAKELELLKSPSLLDTES